MRINKIMSNYGYCSRKQVQTLIREERITINKKLATQGQWVEEDDEILLDHIPIQKKESKYYLYHKPKGILSTMDETKENSLYHALDLDHYVFPVGRLDQDSEGLLLLTNDGELAQKILEPTLCHEKEYRVTVDSPLTKSFICHMAKGVDIKIGKTLPCQMTKISNTEFNIILTQGLNRQIRRMTFALGFKVIKLKRIRILNLLLNDLPPGSHRPLSHEELKNLRKALQFSAT